MIKTIGILLAAGSSSRLGQPKQLLEWKNQPFIVHTLSELQAVCSEVWVVLGAQSKEIRKVLPKDTIILVNEEWEKGMGSSIRLGINRALDQKSIDWVLISLCDQPQLDRSHFTKLIESHLESGAVATAYEQRGGVPALFHRKYWNTLVQFSGDAGARSIINHSDNSIPWIQPTADPSDVDTLEDYQKLLRKSFLS